MRLVSQPIFLFFSDYSELSATVVIKPTFLSNWDRRLLSSLSNKNTSHFISRQEGKSVLLSTALQTGSNTQLPHYVSIRSFSEVLEHARPRRMAQFPERFDFNLSNALTRDIEVLTHFFKCAFTALSIQTEPQA